MPPPPILLESPPPHNHDHSSVRLNGHSRSTAKLGDAFLIISERQTPAEASSFFSF